MAEHNLECQCRVCAVQKEDCPIYQASLGRPVFQKPQPKFRVGQWVTAKGDAGPYVIHSRYLRGSRDEQQTEPWYHVGHAQYSRAAPESDLEPCAPDPRVVLPHGVWPGQKYRVCQNPVNEIGYPIVGGDAEFANEVVTIDRMFRGGEGWVVVEWGDRGGCIRAFNLRELAAGEKP